MTGEHTREIIGTMLGRRYKFADGTVWQVNTVSGPTRDDVMNFRNVGLMNYHDVGEPYMMPNPAGATGELRKIPCGVAMDALYHGMIEEVFE